MGIIIRLAIEWRNQRNDDVIGWARNQRNMLIKFSISLSLLLLLLVCLLFIYYSTHSLSKFAHTFQSFWCYCVILFIADFTNWIQLFYSFVTVGNWSGEEISSNDIERVCIHARYILMCQYILLNWSNYKTPTNI